MRRPGRALMGLRVLRRQLRLIRTKLFWKLVGDRDLVIALAMVKLLILELRYAEGQNWTPALIVQMREIGFGRLICLLPTGTLGVSRDPARGTHADQRVSADGGSACEFAKGTGARIFVALWCAMLTLQLFYKPNLQWQAARSATKACVKITAGVLPEMCRIGCGQLRLLAEPAFL